MKAQEKARAQKRRHRRVRKKVVGSPERPRLAVYRSNRHIYAQVIDDSAGVTLASASSMSSSDTGGSSNGSKGRPKDAARAVGLALAAKARDSGVDEVVFDRSGFRFHGRIKAVAEGAREGGLRL